MHRRLRALSVVFLCLVACTCAPGKHERAPVQLTVLHVNDFHGHLLPFRDPSSDKHLPVGGAARLAHMIDEERDRNPQGTLLLAAGDMLQGTPIANIFHGEPVIHFMNALRFDASAVGNHEFDWGRTILQQRLAAANFPFVVANLVDADGLPPAGMKPYCLLSRQGIRMAAIGVITPDTAFTTHASCIAGLTFLDPAAVLPAVVEEVRREGAQVVIVLSHVGFRADLELAARVPGIDLIVGGHSHTVVPRPHRVGTTRIVQAGYYGLYLGVIQITVDPADGAILDVSSGDTLRPVRSGPGDAIDANTERLVDAYDERIREQMERVVGQTAVDLVRNPGGESNLGNLVADAMREATGADIAFQNAGGLRADIASGNITLEQLYATLSFDNVVVSMGLSGEQILTLLEVNATREQPALQVSGLTMAIERTGSPGARVKEVLVGGVPLARHKRYRVATNDFLAAGGDRFAAFRDGTEVRYGGTLRDEVSAFLARHSPIHARVEGRIVFQP
jgi:2',3'-cyclic-nucleotide 2'-phosphodiesterase (5'-nucleotidase family)